MNDSFSLDIKKQAIIMDNNGIKSFDISKELKVPIPLLMKWIKNSTSILKSVDTCEKKRKSGTIENEPIPKPKRQCVRKPKPVVINPGDLPADEPGSQLDLPQITTSKPKRQYSRKPKPSLPDPNIPSECSQCDLPEITTSSKPKRQYSRKPKQSIPDPSIQSEVILEEDVTCDLPEIPTLSRPKRQYSRKPKQSIPDPSIQSEVILEEGATCDLDKIESSNRPKRQYRRKPTSSVPDPNIQGDECSQCDLPQITSSTKPKRQYSRKPKPTITQPNIQSGIVFEEETPSCDLSEIETSSKPKISCRRKPKPPNSDKYIQDEVILEESSSQCDLPRISISRKLSSGRKSAASIPGPETQREITVEENLQAEIPRVSISRISASGRKSAASVLDTSAHRKSYIDREIQRDTPQIETISKPKVMPLVKLKDIKVKYEEPKDTDLEAINYKKLFVGSDESSSLSSILTSSSERAKQAEIEKQKPKSKAKTKPKSKSKSQPKSKPIQENPVITEQTKPLTQKTDKRIVKVPPRKARAGANTLGRGPRKPKKATGLTAGMTMPSNYVVSEIQPKVRKQYEYTDVFTRDLQHYPEKQFEKITDVKACSLKPDDTKIVEQDEEYDSDRRPSKEVLQPYNYKPRSISKVGKMCKGVDHSYLNRIEHDLNIPGEKLKEAFQLPSFPEIKKAEIVTMDNQDTEHYTCGHPNVELSSKHSSIKRDDLSNINKEDVPCKGTTEELIDDCMAYKPEVTYNCSDDDGISFKEDIQCSKSTNIVAQQEAGYKGFIHADNELSNLKSIVEEDVTAEPYVTLSAISEDLKLSETESDVSMISVLDDEKESCQNTGIEKRGSTVVEDINLGLAADDIPMVSASDDDQSSYPDPNMKTTEARNQLSEADLTAAKYLNMNLEDTDEMSSCGNANLESSEIPSCGIRDSKVGENIDTNLVMNQLLMTDSETEDDSSFISVDEIKSSCKISNVKPTRTPWEEINDSDESFAPESRNVENIRPRDLEDTSNKVSVSNVEKGICRNPDAEQVTFAPAIETERNEDFDDNW